MSPQADALSTRIMRFLPPRMLSTYFAAFIIVRFCWSLDSPSFQNSSYTRGPKPWMTTVGTISQKTWGSSFWPLAAETDFKTALEMKRGSLEVSPTDEARQHFPPKALLCRGHCRRRTSSLGLAVSLVTVPLETTIFSLKAHWLSVEKFAQHQRNHSGGKANWRVCGWRPCISRRAPAGKRPAGGLERSLRGAERTAIRSESGTSPLLAVLSEEKPVFRPGQLKINSKATAGKG